MAELRKRGYTAHIVEKVIPHSFIKVDFGGFADILAYKSNEVGVLAIQCCADNGGSVTDHVKKIMNLNPTGNEKTDSKNLARYQNVVAWLGARNRFEIWGWGLRGERGKRKEWTLRAIPFLEQDMPQP